MRKELLLKAVLLFVLFPFTATQAKENTSVETFIRQVKETNRFAEVSNIWAADNSYDKTEMLKSVEKAQPLTIDYSAVTAFMQQNNTAVNLVIPRADGSTYTIELAQYKFLSNDFQVHTIGANKKDVLTGYTPGLYYSGIVKDIPGSVAAFSFFNNEVYGIFSIPGEGNYVLVPNTLAGEYYNYNQHYILYNDNDLKIKDQAPKCGTDMLPKNYLVQQKTSTTLNNKAYQTCRNVRVFQVADYATYTKKGNSTTNVTNYLTAVFNNLTTLYRNEGVPVLLSYVEIHSATDPYQSGLPNQSNRWLTKFGYITQNTLHGCDLAMLISTHSGNMGGIAWLQSACSGYYAPDSAGPYAFCNVNNSSTTTSTAFPTYSWDVEVCTHEMGHIVGSPHTHACCWNPPARNTAIDGCYTLEGSCSNPGTPSGGGTIMSYCHLTSVGINFSLGFGQQPGDTVRYYLKHASCGAIYTPSIVLPAANRTLTANKECTDLSTGITYYWTDANTVDPSDDTLVLMIQKNGNNIGSLNDAGFYVKTTTLANYGAGLADTIIFPAGTPHVLPPSYSMRRYWQVKATTEPTTAVEVTFPFLPADSADVDGSSPGHPSPAIYKMYKVHSPINPDPKTDSFRYTTTANVAIYTPSSSTSTTTWKLTRSGTTYLAGMEMTKLSGGGTGFYAAYPAGVGQVSAVSDNIFIFPNPTNNEWFVLVNDKSDQLTFQLYAADGKVVHTQLLTGNGATNTINTQNMPAGVYYYRIINDGNAYTGTLIKR